MPQVSRTTKVSKRYSGKELLQALGLPPNARAITLQPNDIGHDDAYTGELDMALDFIFDWTEYDDEARGPAHLLDVTETVQE